MRKSVRNALFWTFSAVFLLLGPTLVFYTAGYRISLNNQRIRHSGALDIETWPRGATISLNGQETGEKTPTVLSSLLPGEVTLTLQRANTIPWQQTITMQQGTTQYIDALLFAEATAEPLSTAPAPTATVAPAHAPIFTSLGTAVEVRLKDGSDPIALLPRDTYTTRYSEKNLIIITGSRAAFAITLSPVTARPLPIIPTLVASHPTTHGKALLLSDGESVWQYNAETAEQQLITRSSSPITAVLWHPSGFAFLLAGDEGLIGYSKDVYAHGRAVTPLFTGLPIRSLALDRRGEFATFQLEDGSFMRLQILP